MKSSLDIKLLKAKEHILEKKTTKEIRKRQKAQKRREKLAAMRSDVPIPDRITKNSSKSAIMSNLNISSETAIKLLKKGFDFFSENYIYLIIVDEIAKMLGEFDNVARIRSGKAFFSYVNSNLPFYVSPNVSFIIDHVCPPTHIRDAISGDRSVNREIATEISRLYNGGSLREFVSRHLALSKGEFKTFIKSSANDFRDAIIETKLSPRVKNWRVVLRNRELVFKLTRNRAMFNNDILSTVTKLLNHDTPALKISEVIDFINAIFGEVREEVLRLGARRIIEESDLWHDSQDFDSKYEHTVWEGRDLSKKVREVFNKDGVLEYILEIVEIVTAKDLKIEGKAQRHCVASYVRYCVTGTCSILSLRKRDACGQIVRMVTIEVRRDNIVQCRGKANRECTQHERAIIANYASTTGLKVQCF